MNITRLTTIAEWLEAGAPHRDGVGGFDMRTFLNPLNDCGTTCCIAGAAIQFFGDQSAREVLSRGRFVAPTATAILGLSEGSAKSLFFGFAINGDIIDLREVTVAWAARCIRKLIATGVVDWEGTREEVRP